MKKTFELRDILSITTGRLLTKPKNDKDNGISSIYILLEHMTGNAPFTHSLPRFAKECEPYLLKWIPELDSVDLKLLDEQIKSHDPKIGIEMWLDLCVLTCGLKKNYEIGQIPTARHSIKNPINELTEALDV